jgi:glycerate kinase
MSCQHRSHVVVVAPDSFKGSLTAKQAADAIGRGVLRALPQAIVRAYPMADGGEGTLDALVRDGSRLMVSARNAAGNTTMVATGLLNDGSGVIEVAEIVGITDSEITSVPVSERTTLGVGDALLALLDRKVKGIAIALGGSSTNDAGAGMLSALGMRLFDQYGNPLPPIPSSLGKVRRVDVSNLDCRLQGVDLLVMSDVDNPLTGRQGATAVFGPQKGVTTAQVGPLDDQLANFATHLEHALGFTAQDASGAGAAGGLGFALKMLGAKVHSGAEAIADAIDLDEALVDADWAITGEGRSDGQTLRGKAPYVLCQRARKLTVPASLLSGAIDAKSLPALNQHFAGCFSIVPGPIALTESLAQADVFLSNAAEQMARLWAAASCASGG